MLCTLGWGCVGSARKTAKPTVLGRDTHHSRAQCRTGLSMEAAAGAAAQAPAPQCVVCGAPTTTDVVPHEARKRQRKNKRGSRGARGRANLN